MSIKASIKSSLKKHPIIINTGLAIINHLPFNNKLKLRTASLKATGSLLRNCSFDVRGLNNTIEIAPRCRLKNCKIFINGSNNKIIIDNDAFLNCAVFYIEDEKNTISVGRHTSITGKTELACIEGCEISIGENCLFSSDITFRTGDSHSILDLEGKRINPSKNIVIGNHVWIGHKAVVNKGVNISENSIIGTGAIVTKSFNKSGVIIAGVPAKIIKEDVNWDANRISIESLGE